MKLLKFIPYILLALPAIPEAQVAERFDLVITEIMADPSPSIGLPNAEYIEVRNRSTKSISLNGWKLGDEVANGSISSSYILKPDSIVILCANSQVNNFSAFGKALGVTGFPSFDNDGDLISLQSSEGKTIHAVAYSSLWFPNSLKKEGGWSLEMIDPDIPCTGEKNWTASTHIQGGTPGQINSVDGTTIDHDPPQLLRTYNKDSITFIAVFNESLDSASASDFSNYSINNNMIISNAFPIAPLFREVALQLSAPLQTEKVYELLVRNVTDCMNNTIGVFNKTKAGLAIEAVPSDIVINEILFNSKQGAYDFVELKNRSEKIIDASGIYIANRNASGDVGSLKKASESKFNLYPGEHYVITENALSLGLNYFVKEPGCVFQINTMPSYPDDKGTVIITNSQGLILDEVQYSDKWHFALISNPEGVSLERLDPEKSSLDKFNWHSASYSSGFATPTSVNSQAKQDINSNSGLVIHPEIFSPDSDGFDDMALIQYRLEEPGYVANVIIFDVLGRPVRYLVKNGLTGLKGSWTWDGLNDKMEKLPVGSYIIYTEFFNLQGKKKHFRNSIALARMMK